MANIKSKIKRIKTNEKSRVRNAANKSRVRTAIKKAKESIAQNVNDSRTTELISKAHKEINTSVSKGVFHKNNGSRKSSKLDKFYNKNK